MCWALGRVLAWTYSGLKIDFEGWHAEKMPAHENRWIFLQRAIKSALPCVGYEACKGLWILLFKSELKVRSEFPWVLNFLSVCQGRGGDRGHDLLTPAQRMMVAGRAVPQDLAKLSLGWSCGEIVPHPCGGMFHIVRDTGKGVIEKGGGIGVYYLSRWGVRVRNRCSDFIKHRQLRI